MHNENNWMQLCVIVAQTSITTSLNNNSNITRSHFHVLNERVPPGINAAVLQ